MRKELIYWKKMDCPKSDLKISFSARKRALFQPESPDLAIEGAAAELQTPGGVVFVPVGLLEHLKNQAPFVFRQGGG